MFDVALSNALRGFKLELSIVDRSGKVANFHALKTDLVAAFQQGTEEAARETWQMAYERTPVDKGFMRDHLVLLISPNRQTFEVGWRAADFFGAGLAFYPMFVVLGTRHVAPNDPLTPAYQQTKPRYEARIRELVGAALDRRRMR